MTAPDVFERPSWFEYAACQGADPDLFFPGRGEQDAVNAAKAVCAGCDVRSPCLEYALANNEETGIWGGFGHRERKRIRRQRRRRGAA